MSLENIPTKEEFRLSALRGAVCEYLDENAGDALLLDFRKVLVEERDKFRQMANNYDSLLIHVDDMLFSNTMKPKN